jgi:hypothetical protein
MIVYICYKPPTYTGQEHPLLTQRYLTQPTLLKTARNVQSRFLITNDRKLYLSSERLAAATICVMHWSFGVRYLVRNNFRMVFHLRNTFSTHSTVRLYARGGHINRCASYFSLLGWRNCKFVSASRFHVSDGPSHTCSAF